MNKDEQEKILRAFENDGSSIGLPGSSGSEPSEGMHSAGASFSEIMPNDPEVASAGFGGLDSGGESIKEVLERILTAIEDLPEKMADRFGVDE